MTLAAQKKPATKRIRNFRDFILLPPTKADDVTVGILYVEVLRTPRCVLEWLQNRYSVGDALFEESLDAIDAGCSIEVLIIATSLPLILILRCFLQV